MTRARRLARGLIALAGVTFVVVLGFLWRRPGARPDLRLDPIAQGLLGELDPKIRDQGRFQGFVYEETGGGEGRYRLSAREAIVFQTSADQMFRLKDATFETTQKASGRTVAISAPRAELAKTSRDLKVYGGFRIEGEAISLQGASFRYDASRRVFASEGPVLALRGSLVGRADSGLLETKEGLVVLDGNVRLRGAENGRTIDVKARIVKIGRTGSLWASGDVVVKSDGQILRAEEVDRLVEKPGAGDALRASGRASLLVGPREDGSIASPVLAAGDTLTLRRQPDGRPENLELSRDGAPAVLDAAPAGPTGSRRAVSARFEARFAEGRLEAVSAPGAVTAVESAPAGRPIPLRSLVSGSARLSFEPDGRTLSLGTFEGGVSLDDAGRATLRSASGSLRGADQTGVFIGTPSTPAEYHDARGQLTASSITYSKKEDQVDASGAVKASFVGGDKSPFPGGSPNEPYSSESDAFRLRLKEKALLLTGNVRAWQRDNVIRCQKLALDDEKRSLRAEGKVRVLLRRLAGAGPSTKAAKPTVETVNASGDLLTHREADKLVRIEGSSEIVSGAWVLGSEVTDIHLGPDRSIAYAEARGKVTLEDRVTRRRGEGAKASWRPLTDVVQLEGAPAVALDGRGNRLTGATLTFRQGQQRVDCESSPAIPCEGLVHTGGS